MARTSAIQVKREGKPVSTIAITLLRQGIGVRLWEHDEDVLLCFWQPTRRQQKHGESKKSESHEYRVLQHLRLARDPTDAAAFDLGADVDLEIIRPPHLDKGANRMASRGSVGVHDDDRCAKDEKKFYYIQPSIGGVFQKIVI